jgi:hypothetical protein
VTGESKVIAVENIFMDTVIGGAVLSFFAMTITPILARAN